MNITYEVEKTARELVSASCDAMDREDFGAYLELCSPQYKYAIRAYSPEIRRDMLWLEKDFEHLKTLLEMIPKQNRDRTPLVRKISVREVTSGGDNIVNMRCDLTVYRVVLDGGEAQVFGVGKYTDRIDMSGQPKLLEREVRLESRNQGLGYHVPL